MIRNARQSCMVRVSAGSAGLPARRGVAVGAPRAFASLRALPLPFHPPAGREARAPGAARSAENAR
jgi:hypothetical protein